MVEGYSFKWIEMEDIKEACHLMTDGFIKLNDIYQRQGSRYQDLHPVFYFELEHSIKYHLTYAIYFKDKMVGVTINHDMHYYPKLNNTYWLKGQSKMISIERKYVQKIEEELLNSSYEPGVAIYGMYGCVTPEYASKGISLYSIGYMLNQLGKRGFKRYFGTACSEQALNLFVKNGSVIMRQLKCDEPGMEGDKYTLFHRDLTDSEYSDQGLSKQNWHKAKNVIFISQKSINIINY